MAALADMHLKYGDRCNGWCKKQHSNKQKKYRSPEIKKNGEK